MRDVSVPAEGKSNTESRVGWTAPLAWLLLVAASADLVALKTGTLQHAPEYLAALFGSALLVFFLRLLQLAWRMTRKPTRSLRAAAEILLVGGLALALGGGTVNWLFGLQGTVILNEREAVNLRGGSALQAFESGPLAEIDEMGLSVVLDELELVPFGEGGFVPASLLRVWREGEKPTRLRATSQSWASWGTLRFHQGAFGFAPQIVILNADETVFDRVVPFLSEREGPAGVAFLETFTIEKESLEVEGQVDLATLDEGLRGHAALTLTVGREGELLGQGRLLPGHFAEIGAGYRVGFAGLERWSEIVVSRHNYPGIMLTGAAMALLGALSWPLAWWKER